MNHDLNLLAEAKRRLPLPALMAQLGHGDHAKKSARCPWHDDTSASFSTYQRPDSLWAWKCHAGCGGGDEADYIAKLRGISNTEACREFIKLAGVEGAAPAAPSCSNASHTPVVRSSIDISQPPFDWPQCVREFAPDQAARFAKWRSLTPEFVAWLHSHRLIGVVRNRLAFPVHDTGNVVVRAHIRAVKRLSDGSESVFWFYTPKGPGLPYIIGDARTARTVWAFESQFDMLAALDLAGWHKSPDGLPGIAAVATRGAENGKRLAGLFSPDSMLLLFPQNDATRTDRPETPAQKWTREAAVHSGCKSVQIVSTPGDFKDLNDALRAGLTPEEFQTALAAARPYTPPIDLHAAPPRHVSKPVITLPPEDDADAVPAPFPTACLPSAIALIVRSVADTLRVPDALPGTMALALVAASIGKGLALDWRPGKAPTPANQFVILSAESGSGKSECYKLVAEPYLAFERAMQERWPLEVMPQLQADLRYHEGQCKKLDKSLARAFDPQEIDRCRGQMQFHLAKVEELKTQLHEPQLSIQDATVEKAAVVMHRNDETTFSTSSDARKLVDNILGRYSANKLADDGIYLCAFSGDDVKVDRQGREGVRLANPCMTLLWALQPDVLDMLLGEVTLQQGGFLARCLLAHTHAEPQLIDGSERGVTDATRARWDTLIRDLLVTYRQPVTLPTKEVIDEEF